MRRKGSGNHSPGSDIVYRFSLFGYEVAFFMNSLLIYEQGLTICDMRSGAAL